MGYNLGRDEKFLRIGREYSDELIESISNQIKSLCSFMTESRTIDKRRDH